MTVERLDVRLDRERRRKLRELAAEQGVPVSEDVRAPLRSLTSEEREELDAWAETALS